MSAEQRLAGLLKRLEHPGLKSIDLSLERMEKFLMLLGHPERRLPPVVHVAGTNGKGSLLAYLKAILQAAGYRVHRYTSPHLVRFSERIEIAGNMLADEDMLELLQEIETYVARQNVTFFEATTAAAFLAFSRTPADIVLLETGLGGRLDATNVIADPLLTAIMPIGFDHKEYLGDTLAQIAAEKAGILKKGVTCVVAPQEPQAEATIEQHAQALGAPLLRHGKEWHSRKDRHGFNVTTPHAGHQRLHTPLAGAHQQKNATVAVVCADELKSRYAISDEHIREGLSCVSWPARLQRLTMGPLPHALGAAGELWLDGAHNAHAARALAAWIKNRHDARTVYIITGILAGKDATAFFSALAWCEATILAVPIRGENCHSPDSLAQMAHACGFKAHACRDIEEALRSIVESCGGAALVIIAGSLYLCGQVLQKNA